MMMRDRGHRADEDAMRGASEPWELPIVDTARWIGREPPPRRWIVHGWLARATGGALFGEDGVGKSLLAQQLATCVAANKPFLGLQVTQAGALYLTCEDDELSLWERQRAINRALGVPIEAAPAVLSTLAGFIATELGLFGEDGTFEPGPMFHAIARRAKAVAAGLIVLDNIAHLFPGNEIVRRQVVAFLAAVDQLAMQCDAAVLLLGHPAKTAGSEYSGNAGWSAHVRQRWFMGWPNDDEEAAPDGRILRKAKANLSKRGEEIPFLWREWAFVTHDDLPASEAAEIAANAAMARDNALFLACLAERTKQQRAVSEKRSSSYAPAVFVTMAEAKGTPKRRLEAAMDRLFRLQRIERAELPWKHQRKPVEGLREVRADGAERCADRRADGAPTLCADAPDLSAPTSDTHTLTIVGESAPHRDDALSLDDVPNPLGWANQ